MAPPPPLPELIDLDEHVMARARPRSRAGAGRAALAPSPGGARGGRARRRRSSRWSSCRPPDPSTGLDDLGASLEAGELHRARRARSRRSTAWRRPAWARSSARCPTAVLRCRRSTTSEPVRAAAAPGRAARGAGGDAPTLAATVPTAHERSAAERPPETLERRCRGPGHAGSGADQRCAARGRRRRADAGASPRGDRRRGRCSWTR